VINYDLVFRRPYFAHISGFTLVLDESSIVQNETAKRSKFILKMKPKNVILLSGTPTAGKYEKLWSQLHLLGWEISKDLFYKQYVEIEWIEDHNSGFRIPQIVGYKNVDRLKRKLAEHGAIFMKSEEVFDLPEQVIIPVYSKPTKEYRKFMRDAVITIDGREFIGDTILSKRIYARMMCSYLNKGRVAV
jgi:SNF2 family DNA or RNA helicase